MNVAVRVFNAILCLVLACYFAFWNVGTVEPLGISIACWTSARYWSDKVTKCE